MSVCVELTRDREASGPSPRRRWTRSAARRVRCCASRRPACGCRPRSPSPMPCFAGCAPPARGCRPLCAAPATWRRSIGRATRCWRRPGRRALPPSWAVTWNVYPRRERASVFHPFVIHARGSRAGDGSGRGHLRVADRGGARRRRGAIGSVLASALSPGAVAYARARGEDPDQQANAILIHRTIEGEASVARPSTRWRGAGPRSSRPQARRPEARDGSRAPCANWRSATARVEIEWVRAPAG